MRHPAPTLFINVFNLEGKDMPLEDDGVVTTRTEAVKNAEELADCYVYTLTDKGVIDLSTHFSEEFRQRRDFDDAVDRKIDQMREEVSSVENA